MDIGQHLSKKTLAPDRQSNTIRRSDLIELLYQGIQNRVTTVSAPPGSGKTTAITDFAAEVEVPVCWYTIKSSDNDIRLMLQGLIRAFSQKFPQIGHALAPVLESSLQPGVKINNIVDTLNHEISLNISEYILIVIEDFHLLEDNTIAKSIINHLIELAPENCHFIITSRNPLILSAITKLAMQQQVLHINASQFAFSIQEIKELFLTAYKTELSQGEAREILDETKGWVPALLLRGVVGDDNLAQKLRHLTREDLYAYLAEEVFQSLPSKTQEFLSNTAILDELIPDFCNVLLDIRNSASILEDLYVRNLFVTRLEGEHPSYRYHSVLKDFLQHQMETIYPEHLLVLHYKAGLIFEKERLWENSIQHFIKARKPAEATRIILLIGEDYIRNGRWLTLLNLLELLPKTQIIASAELLVLKAAALVHLGNSTEAARILTELIDKKNYGNDPLLQAKLLNWRCAALRMMGQFVEAKRDIKNAITILNLYDGPSDLRGDVYRRLGDICAEQGQLKGALRYQRIALKYYNISHNLVLTSQVHNSLGIIYKRLGDLNPAIYHFENAREGWQKLNNYGDLSMTLNNIGIIYQRKGQYEMALHTLQSGLVASKKHGYKRTEACLLLTIGEVLRDAGDYKEALVSFQRGLDIAREVMEPYFITYALLGMGEVERLLGNTDKAAVLLNQASLQAANHGQPYESTLIKIQLALIENEDGRTAKAIKMLGESNNYLSQTGDKNALATVYFYMAHLAFLGKRYDEMKQYLGQLESIVGEMDNTEFLVPICKHAILMLQYCVNKRIGAGLFAPILEKIRRQAALGTPIAARMIEMPKNQNTTSINVVTFGEIRVSVDDRIIKEEEWRSIRAKEIFIYLLSTTSGQTREQVAAALWPDLNPARASSNFHINIYRARQALIPVIFSQDRGKYGINPELNISFDLFHFQQLIKESEKLAGNDRLECLEKATMLYKGPFAPEIYGDWVDRIRQKAEGEYIKALFLMADLYARQHRLARAIEVLERIIQCDPYNDEAYAFLMEFQVAANEIQGAKKSYQKYCQTIVAETNSISDRVTRVLQKMT